MIGDFVGAINEDWLWHFGEEEEGEIITSFPSMPRTTSAIALWLVKLDTLIASYVVEKAPQPEGNQLNRTRKHKYDVTSLSSSSVSSTRVFLV